MELRHLRYLLAVAEEATFVDAAERLRVAQPALTRQIRDLERELGVTLLERDSRGAQLTVEGRAVAAMAASLLERVNAALERTRSSNRGLAGRCVVASGRIPLWTGLVSRLVARVHEEYPEIDLVVEEVEFDRQVAAVRTATADVGLGVPPGSGHRDLVAETLLPYVWDCVIVAPEHPLATRQSVALAELADETFIWFDTDLSAEFNRAVMQVVEAGGISRKRIRGVVSSQAMSTVVASGQGWSIGPSILRERLGATFAFVTVEGMRIPALVSAYWRRGDTRAVVQTVVRVAREVALEAQRGDSAATGAPVLAALSPGDARPFRAELRHLRYFAAVVEERSFGKAAERLELSQPALSRQVRDLETDVGVPLLLRETRGVTPTPAGEALADDAREILDIVRRLPDEVARTVRGTRGQCVIGLVQNPLAHQLALKLVAETSRAHSEYELQTVECLSPRQSAALNEAEIDLGVAHALPLSEHTDPNVLRIRLLDDVLDTALLPATHALAARTSIEARELADIPFIFVGRAFHPPLYDLVMSTLARSGLRPRIEGEFDGLLTTWSLVEQGAGWTLGSRLQRDDPPLGVRAVPLVNVSLPWGFELLMRRDESRVCTLDVAAIAHSVASTFAAAVPPKPSPPRRARAR